MHCPELQENNSQKTKKNQLTNKVAKQADKGAKLLGVLISYLIYLSLNSIILSKTKKARERSFANTDSDVL